MHHTFNLLIGLKKAQSDHSLQAYKLHVKEAKAVKLPAVLKRYSCLSR